MLLMVTFSGQLFFAHERTEEGRIFLIKFGNKRRNTNKNIIQGFGITVIKFEVTSRRKSLLFNQI